MVTSRDFTLYKKLKLTSFSSSEGGFLALRAAARGLGAPPNIDTAPGGSCRGKNKSVMQATSKPQTKTRGHAAMTGKSAGTYKFLGGLNY